MASIGFGLNIPSKFKKLNAPTGPPTRKPIARKPPPGFFGAGANDDDADSKNSDEKEGIFAKEPKFKKPPKRDPTKPPTKPPASSLKSTVNTDLATHTAHSTLQTAAAAAAAAAEDPTIYAYDSLYDSMKSATSTASRANSTAALDDPSTRQPKYMTSLLAAAETRKRDLLRAKERMLQKEREAEGEEFNDKETFVTGAYKAQQEELRKLEEEEAKREEEERKKSKGLSGLYRGLLERGEKAHERAVEAAKEAAVGGKGEGEGEREEEKMEEKKPLPAHVEVNDEGVVVDKRQLLSGGLNLLAAPSASKKPTSAQQSSSTSTNASARGYQGKNKVEMDRRARQTRMLEEQLAATQKRAREEEEAKAKELIERQVKRGKTEGELMGARERYLARKKAKEGEERMKERGGGV
ncbi:coiled-coil domain-containing protein 55-domain containing protein [Tirmania nivea]|nr:coiled-coil domain-containing protein 55-domain containing protein [Tirmania nivea]